MKVKNKPIVPHAQGPRIRNSQPSFPTSRFYKLAAGITEKNLFQDSRGRVYIKDSKGTLKRV